MIGVRFLARSGTSSHLFTTMFVTGCLYHQTLFQFGIIGTFPMGKVITA